ncbi:amidase signature enzyme [Rhizopus microsporus]|uniref:Amidase signature enzyme n=1 Tax=Rhizopus microsporus TaxID=58291 RepID=A0A1X0SDH2_RHIZD|nr:amidase signature enzyme [Rhizopus microsporus]
MDKHVDIIGRRHPILYGWSIVAAANAVEYAPFLNKKLASDTGVLSLRDENDIDDHPTMTPLPLDEPSFHLNAANKSVSQFLSFWDFHKAYTEFKTTPTEVAERLLVKIEQSKDLNWIRFLTKDIMQQAEESTRRYKEKKPLSQLDGVFVAVKEELDIQGLETKVGTCFINDDNPASQDSTIVSRLKNAGAIVVGSTVMNELGWDTFSVNPNTGVPKNPHKSTYHSCGGSSGGSSGSVSGGLFPVTIGTDGGGSVRIPSAFCGLYGLKTTWSRVSSFGGSTQDPSIGAYGPIAATADDMTLTYTIIAGPDPNDPNTLSQPGVDLKDYDKFNDLSGLTIAVVPDWNRFITEPAILERMDKVKGYLKQLGADIVEVDIPDLERAETAHIITISSEMYTFASKYFHKRNYFLPYTRILCGVASVLEGRDYILAQRMRTRMMKHMAELFKNQKIDLILTPTTPMLSPEIPKAAMRYGISNTNLTKLSMVYTTLANFTGIPAVSVPAGYHDDLPIGLQFMASWWNEALLCRIAKTIENMPGIDRKRPEAHWFGDYLL